MENLCNLAINRQKGMSLIELCIAVAIVAILASIAYPNYQSYILKTHRSVAMKDLLNLQMSMEAMRSQTGSYQAERLVNQGMCNSCQSETERYQFAIIMKGTGINRYQITATPKDQQTEDPCGTLSINAGAITSASGEKAQAINCWR